MLEGMSARDLERWRQFDASHPFPDARSEIESARLLSFLETLVAGDKARPPNAYMWSFKVSDRTAQARDIQAKLMAMFGGKVIDGRR